MGSSNGPDVSVVMPVWNVEAYLKQALDSVVHQSIGPGRVEVVAVDDGSTDGSGAILDAYAERHPDVVRVLHEPNSGGPGRPRNLGLDAARGTYVYFLDADDYLGPEALERMVAVAERNRSDVVLGKMVGVGGRLVPHRAFGRNRDRASLEQVYSTLSVLKMFRRATIARVGARFPEGLSNNEDGIFTQRVYLNADVISVVADYDCYYYRSRPDSQTRGGRTKDLLRYLGVMAERMELLAASRPPGRARDRLMAKHVSAVLDAFGTRWVRLSVEDRRPVFAEGARLIGRWHTPLIQAGLAPPLSLRAHCLGHGLFTELGDISACLPKTALARPVVDGRRVYAGFPHFRDASGIPDDCFELTDRLHLRQRAVRADLDRRRLTVSGEAYLRYLGGSSTLVLRRRPWDRTRRLTPEPVATPAVRDRDAAYPAAGFRLAVGLDTVDGGRPLPAGTWGVELRVAAHGVTRSAPLAAAKGGAGLALHVARDGEARLGRARPPLRPRVVRVLRAGRRRVRSQARRALRGVRRRLRAG